MPRRVWATAVLLVAAGITSPAAAQPLAPVGPPPDVLPPAATPVRPRLAPDHPPAVLGAPIAVPGQPVRPLADPIPSTVTDSRPIPAAFSDPPAVQQPSRRAGLGVPTAAGQVTSASAPVPASAAEGSAGNARQAGATASPSDPVTDFLGRRSAYKDDPPRKDDRSAWKFGDKLEGIVGGRGERFRSDHAFDGFISPVTNPFLFEDPRSLTEVRPLFIYQRIPGGQPDFFGGNVSFFGTQARLAVTDRLSFVVHKFGGVWLNPNDASPVGGESGFAELWLGPKFTFIRNEETGSLLAGGLQFQVPIGSKGAFQDTGSLSLVPYATYGQNLFRDFRAGSVNTLASAGYAFSTTKARSDYLFLSGHIDLDVMNWHRFYPLFELNYLLNTTDGNTYPIGAEGRDLFNFGGQAKGKGLLTGAFGARFKITECAQIGTAFEIPLAGPRDLFQYRFTVDFILRY